MDKKNSEMVEALGETNMGDITDINPTYTPYVPSVNLSQLPACVIWQLLSYIDTDTTVSLAGVNTSLRYLVIARLKLAVSLPFTTSFSNHLKQDPYSHNKPVLRMRISHLSPDYIRLDRMLHSNSVHHLPISRQLFLLNLTSLTDLCLHLEQTKFGDIHNYRLAFLALLQSTGVLKQLRKLHLTVHHTFLLNLLPGNFGSRLMKDALSVDHLVISLMEQRANIKEDTSEYKQGLENFVSLVKSTKFALNIFTEPADTTIEKILTNDYIEDFKLTAPCQFRAQLKMSQVRQMEVSTSKDRCPLFQTGHQTGKCVLDRDVVAKGCPKLQVFAGVKVEEFDKIEARKRKESLKIEKARTGKGGGQKRRLRCGDCEGCSRPNCGNCKNCKDMRSFGGKGRLKQVCETRKCEELAGGSQEQDADLGGSDQETQELPPIPVAIWEKFILCTI